MRRLWIAVLPAAAILLLTAPGAFTSNTENGDGDGRQAAEGGLRKPSRPLSAPSGKGTSPHKENSGGISDTWGFIAPLMPAVKAIGDMVKPIIDASGLERELEDIFAALNETSNNPFFIFGIDDTPPHNTPSPTTAQKRHGSVQPQQLNGSKSPPTQQQPPPPKQKGSPLMPLRGLFTQEHGASATPQGPVDGVPSRKAPEKEHHPGHGEEEEESLWRQWNMEDLELL